MRTVFVGAVEGSRVGLDALCAAGLPPALVVTLPPDLAHRHSDYADLAPLAARHGIPLHLTRRSDADETCEAIAALAPDLVLVIGWSQLCGPRFRAIPRLGCIGFHPSALPRLRGRAVIPWTILRGETDGGATLFWLGEGADTGDIAAQRLFPLDPAAETARSLYDKAVGALAAMLPDLVSRLASGELPRRPQDDSRATLCARRGPEDGRIDWHSPADAVARLIRAAGPPYPGAFTHLPGGARIVLTGARLTPRGGYYIGIPGQVQALEGRGFTVACGDGACIDVLDWHPADAGASANPRLHDMLGRPAGDAR
ncbi:methionyl-tRNA formyltransferase [Frigidibacter oleivorans]|uniref:methionyl-tRNA formyltransferase n=1 Tax=Frigidibacter oleivorans TaxID=2487129 RepID=UPI000F8EEC4C|nr:formyltransferase family protein [Frigidibacter oleivorans]